MFGERKVRGRTCDDKLPYSMHGCGWNNGGGHFRQQRWVFWAQVACSILSICLCLSVVISFGRYRSRRFQQVISFMQQNFAGATLREKQNGKMRFEFPAQANQTLADMFGFIEVRFVPRFLPTCAGAGFTRWFPYHNSFGRSQHLTRFCTCVCTPLSLQGPLHWTKDNSRAR